MIRHGYHQGRCAPRWRFLHHRLARDEQDPAGQQRCPATGDRAPKELEIDLVAVDNAAGGVLAAQHLLSLGRRRIACIAGPQGLDISAERVEGMRQALADASMALPERLLRYADFTSAGGYEAARALLSQGEVPDGIFCCNDLMAIGALRAAAELGIAVPQALSVVGFDDIDLARFVHPPLTSVAQNTRRLGQLTAQCLLERIADPSRPIERQTITPELHVRGSTVLS